MCNLPVVLLKLLAKYVTVRQRRSSPCNTLFQRVSFSSYSARSTRRCFSRRRDSDVRRLFFFYEYRRNCLSKIYVATRYASVLSEICSLIARRDDESRGSGCERCRSCGSCRQD